MLDSNIWNTNELHLRPAFCHPQLLWLIYNTYEQGDYYGHTRHSFYLWTLYAVQHMSSACFLRDTCDSLFH